MVGCAAYGCKSHSSRKEPGITFHRFPQELHRLDLWIKNMKIEGWEPSSNDRLCSKHFEQNFLHQINQKVYLLKEAVPTIFEGLPEYLRPKIAKERKRPCDVHLEPSPSTSALAAEDDSPQKKKLRRQLELQKAKNKEKTRKIRVLGQALKRAHRKVASLKMALVSEYEHDFQVQHLHLGKEENVAQKLIDGSSPTEILDAIRDTADPIKSRRIDLLTKADIENIKMDIKKGLNWFSIETQNIKHGIESETSSHISDPKIYNLESVSSELSKRLVESRSPLDLCDVSITEPDGMPQTRYQQSDSEDKVHESMAKLYETRNSCFFELEQLKRNIEQVSDTRILEHVFEELRRLNRHFESESGSRKTLCEFGSENIKDEPLSTETFVIGHDHGYT